jgi:hypothetical protein
MRRATCTILETNDFGRAEQMQKLMAEDLQEVELLTSQPPPDTER